MNGSESDNFLDLAKHLAADAARIGTASRASPEVRIKADDSVVTETDHAIQAHILDAIAHAYPDHAVLAEETVPRPDAHADRASARYCWVIDPLDGTRNYASGLPCFSTSIAVLDRAEPMVAVVAEHNVNHVYTATRGGGARLNGEVIRATARPAQKDLLIGIPSSKDDLTVRVLRAWVATDGFVLRNLGSTAMHLALVASGALDAAFAKRCKIWDIAAGVLLISEAGGVVTDPWGAALCPFDLTADPGEDIPYLAASPAHHKRLLRSIEEALAD